MSNIPDNVYIEDEILRLEKEVKKQEEIQRKYQEKQSLTMIEKERLREAVRLINTIKGYINKLEINEKTRKNFIEKMKKNFTNKMKETQLLKDVSFPDFESAKKGNSESLKKLVDNIKLYIKSKKQPFITKEIIDNFLQDLCNTLDIDKKELDKTSSLTESQTETTGLEYLINFLSFRENQKNVLNNLEHEFQQDYVIYVSFGTSGLMNQIISFDKAFEEKVLNKYSKHLFLNFDSSLGGWNRYDILIKKNAFNKDEGSIAHASRILPLYYHYGIPIDFKRLNTDAFEYKLQRSPDNEIRFIFFNMNLNNLLYPLLKNLVEKAEKKFLICAAVKTCDAWTKKYDLFFNNFDFYINSSFMYDFYYTTSFNKPYFYQTISEKINNVHLIPVLEPMKKKPNNIRIVNLRALKGKKNENIFNIRKHFTQTYQKFFNKNKLETQQVPFKGFGDPTFWNIVGGNQTRKAEKKRKQRKTRKQ